MSRLTTIDVPGDRVKIVGSVVPIPTRSKNPPDDLDYQVALDSAMPYTKGTCGDRDEVTEGKIAFNCYAVAHERDCPGPPWHIEELANRDDSDMARWRATLEAVAWRDETHPAGTYRIPYAIYYVESIPFEAGVIDPDD